ncbi:MAG: glycoside hydrolase family 127 protein [Anaerolineae bacterium]|nr:glycoside hydrolase family 127 protein [Anaerolineae bacterium]
MPQGFRSSIKKLHTTRQKFLKNPSCTYADSIENLLYNSILASIAKDGQSIDSTNDHFGGVSLRQNRFTTPCCPPDYKSAFTSIPSLIYSVSPDTIWVNQYVANETQIIMQDGQQISILQRTRYPWDGNVIIEILDNCRLNLRLRIPGWSASDVTVNINGDIYKEQVLPGTYLEIDRNWLIGDSVCIQFPLRVRRIAADDLKNAKYIAFLRGPLLYCFESADNPDIDLAEVCLQKGGYTSEFLPRLLQGVQVIDVPAKIPRRNGFKQQTANTGQHPQSDSLTKPVTLMAVPYFTWGNRGPGQMAVWLRESQTIDTPAI